MSKTSTWVRIVIAIVIGAFSFFGAAKIWTTPESHESAIQYLDEKKVSVLELAGAATASSLAISALPNDTATPIANELANLSKYFLIIVSAIVLEKSLVTVTGFLAFKWIIPFACLLYIVFALSKNESFKKVSVKLAAFGLIIFLLVPASAQLSVKIEQAYDYSASEAVEMAKENADSIKKEAKTEGKKETKAAKEGKKSNGKWWNNILAAVSDGAETLKDAATNGISNVKEKAGDLLNRFIDALAILIVTSCVIPILILLAFLWVIKLMFSLDINVPSFGTIFNKVKKEKHGATIDE